MMNEPQRTSAGRLVVERFNCTFKVSSSTKQSVLHSKDEVALVKSLVHRV